MSSLYIVGLKSKSYVANEFLNLLTCFEIPEHGLDKLVLQRFEMQCFPFEEGDVISRLAEISPCLSSLQMSFMDRLT